MSDAPSKSNADIDKPRRGIGRFLWLNAIMTGLGCLALALFSDNIYVLYPLAFGALIGGIAVIFREMFALLGQDSQYQVDEVAADAIAGSVPEVASARPAAQPRPTVHAA